MSDGSARKAVAFVTHTIPEASVILGTIIESTKTVSVSHNAFGKTLLISVLQRALLLRKKGEVAEINLR